MQPKFVALANTGGMGMAIFFTLSGYVIALSYSDWDWRQRPCFNLVSLFLYRCARLYPAFFVFAVLMLLRTPVIRNLSDPQVQSYLLSRMALVYTWLPQLTEKDHFHVAWSLSVEVGLYLMFGIGAILAAWLPIGRYKSLLLALLILVGLWQLPGLVQPLRRDFMPEWEDWVWHSWVFLYSPWGVSLQFGIGVLAYGISRNLPDRIAALASNAGGLGLVATYLAIATGWDAYPWDHALLVSVSTGLLMIGCQSRTVTNAALSGRVIV